MNQGHLLKEGDKIVTEVENVKTKERQKLVSDGVFIFIGMKPNIDLFRDKLELDSGDISKLMKT